MLHPKQALQFRHHERRAYEDVLPCIAAELVPADARFALALAILLPGVAGVVER
jgi:hypothetical protein